MSKDFDIIGSIPENKNDIGLLMIRLVVGGAMLVHGINKILMGNGFVEQAVTNVGLPTFIGSGVFLGEVVGPILLILGFKTRLGGFLVAFNMLIAVMLVHAADIVAINEAGGWSIELNALYFFGALALVFMGSGKFAISKGNGLLD